MGNKAPKKSKNPCLAVRQLEIKTGTIDRISRLLCFNNFFESNPICKEVFNEQTINKIRENINLLLHYPLSMWRERENKMYEQIFAKYYQALSDETYRSKKNIKCNGDSRLKF